MFEEIHPNLKNWKLFLMNTLYKSTNDSERFVWSLVSQCLNSFKQKVRVSNFRMLALFNTSFKFNKSSRKYFNNRNVRFVCCTLLTKLHLIICIQRRLIHYEISLLSSRVPSYALTCSIIAVQQYTVNNGRNVNYYIWKPEATQLNIMCKLKRNKPIY